MKSRLTTRMATNANAGNLAAALAAEHWCRQIRNLWTKRATNTLELARMVCQARQSLRYGVWGRMWASRQSLFSKRTADKLVSIGRHLGRLDENNCAHLPTRWNTLYWLSLLGAATVELCIKQGTIHPGLTSGEAKQLLATYRGHGEGQKRKRFNVRQRLRRFLDFLVTTLSDWKPEELQLARAELRGLLARIDPDSGSAPARASTHLRGSNGDFRPIPNRSLVPKIQVEPTTL